jgi:hypothetical protein
MKALKYILYLIVGLVILFFALGFITPSVNYGHEITVSKSVREAWAVSQDESKYDQWLAGFKSIELLSGELGAVGSTYKVVVNPGDGQDDFVMTETLVSLKEFDHVEMHFDSDMMNFEQTISFAENNGATTVTTQSRVRGKSIMMRAMFAWMELLSGSFKAQEIKNIEALKTLINENTTDYFPVPVEPELEEEMEEGDTE